MSKKNQDGGVTRIEVRDKQIAKTIDERIRAWARFQRADGKVTGHTPDWMTLYVSGGVPLDVVQKATEHYRRIKVQYPC